MFVSIGQASQMIAVAISTFARVSSHDQKKDLERQIKRLEDHIQNCNFYGTTVEVLEEKRTKDFESELVADVIEIMTVFTAKIYGKRSHRKRAA